MHKTTSPTNCLRYWDLADHIRIDDAIALWCGVEPAGQVAGTRGAVAALRQFGDKLVRDAFDRRFDLPRDVCKHRPKPVILRQRPARGLKLNSRAYRSLPYPTASPVSVGNGAECQKSARHQAAFTRSLMAPTVVIICSNSADRSTTPAIAMKSPRCCRSSVPSTSSCLPACSCKTLTLELLPLVCSRS